MNAHHDTPYGEDENLPYKENGMDSYVTEGQSSKSQFFLWQLILFVGLIIGVVVAWPHLLGNG